MEKGQKLALKLLHFSDLHLTDSDAPIYGVKPLENFKSLLQQALKHHNDANLIILSGDISQDGTKEGYGLLKNELAGLDERVVLTLGNHDKRENFLEVFNGRKLDYFLDYNNLRLIVLDTSCGEKNAGLIKEEVLAKLLSWLDTDLRVIITMHHNPFLSDIPSIDSENLLNEAELLDIIKKSGKRVHFITGHLHRNIFGFTDYFSYSCVKATSSQLAIYEVDSRYTRENTRPGFAILLVDADGIKVHFQDLIS